MTYCRGPSSASTASADEGGRERPASLIRLRVPKRQAVGAACAQGSALSLSTACCLRGLGLLAVPRDRAFCVGLRSDEREGACAELVQADFQRRVVVAVDAGDGPGGAWPVWRADPVAHLGRDRQFGSALAAGSGREGTGEYDE